MLAKEICIDKRWIGEDYEPFVIAEIGINHNGEFDKAKKMICDARQSGAECVKFQCHIIDDEMIKNDVIPGNTDEPIWKLVDRCSFNEQQEIELKELTESLGMIYLSTPFSRAAADRLEKMNVLAYKIGSGECNNIPLIKHIASFGKPIILSTGMNDLSSISESVLILEDAKIDYALLHVTSIYPTPYDKVRLNALAELKREFPNAVIGLSDHSIDNYTCFAAIPYGTSILEKHFTSDKNWDGPDIPVSIDPKQLKDLIHGSKAIHQALDGHKDILPEENPTIAFAYASVVTTEDIKKGEILTENNIWVKRPGTGEIRAKDYEKLLKKTILEDVEKNTQLKWSMIRN
jgi:N-acetylneuraminate synthase